MARYAHLNYEIEIPEGVEAVVDGTNVTIKGEKGEINKEFDHTGVKIDFDQDTIILNTLFPRKKEKALIGTVRSHIENMVMGVQYGYRYYLKIVFSHFPIRVNPENNKNRVKIENLYGGRKPLYAKVLPGVTVSLSNDKEDVVVEGPDKDAVGQTAANIQELCRQRGSRRKSPKTFMDGIYIYDKEFMEEPPEELKVPV